MSRTLTEISRDLDRSLSHYRGERSDNRMSILMPGLSPDAGACLMFMTLGTYTLIGSAVYFFGSHTNQGRVQPIQILEIVSKLQQPDLKPEDCERYYKNYLEQKQKISKYPSESNEYKTLQGIFKDLDKSFMALLDKSHDYKNKDTDTSVEESTEYGLQIGSETGSRYSF